MTTVGIFYENPFRAGGTETWILNICKIYKDKYDITIYYPYNLFKGENIPTGAYDRLAQMVKLVPVSTEQIKVDVAIFAFDYFHLQMVDAEKKFLFIHPGDGHGNHPRKPEEYSEFTGVVGVSQYTVNKMAKWCPGLDVIRVYDPVPEQELRLLSLSRSAKDKGWTRMTALAEALHNNGVKFRWDVYTDYQGVNSCKYMKFHKPTIHAIDKIRESDFLVQLSDHESFGYSMVEGIQYSKLIVTDIEILPEMGISKDNAVIVPMKNADYNEVVKDILSRTYTPPQTDYKVLFGEPDNVKKTTRIKVKCTVNGDIYIQDQDTWVEDDGSPTFIYKTKDALKMIKTGYLKEV